MVTSAIIAEVSAAKSLTDLPTVPGWLAPTVIVSGCGTLVNFLLALYNLARSTAKAKRDEILGIEIEHFKVTVKGPISDCLKKLTKACVEFGSFEALADDIARQRFADEFQLNTLNPIINELSFSLEQANRFSVRSTDGNWSDEIDRLDDVIQIIGDLRSTAPIVYEKRQILCKKFAVQILEFCETLNRILRHEEDEIRGRHNLSWLGSRYVRPH